MCLIIDNHQSQGFSINNHQSNAFRAILTIRLTPSLIQYFLYGGDQVTMHGSLWDIGTGPGCKGLLSVSKLFMD
jgi:hypothetical protein